MIRLRTSSLTAALLALLACPNAVRAQRVEAVAAPISGAGAVTAAPAAALTATPSALIAPTAALAPAALLAAAPVAAAPAPLLAAAPAALTPAAPLASLQATGAKIDAASRPGSREPAPAALDSLFEGGPARASGGDAVSGGRVSLTGPRLAPSSKGEGRRMPAGVRAAFQKSAVMGGGMAALMAALWPMIHSLAPSVTPAAFALVAFPMALLPLHFALVSMFWAGRYYVYPKLSDAGKTAFRGSWTALAAAYPVAATLALGAWTMFVASQPTLLLMFSPVLALAAGEVIHHFLYRITPERAQDKGKPLTDWNSRAGGNVGQQLRRMRRKGA